MVLTLTLLAILAGVGAKAVASGFNSYLSAKTLAPLADQGHLAMQRIMVELKGASFQSLSRPNGSDSLQMTSSQGDTLLFSSSPTLSNTLVMQVNGGPEKILLESVGTVEFDIGNNHVISIDMTMSGVLNGGGVLSLPLHSSVYVGIP